MQKVVAPLTPQADALINDQSSFSALIPTDELTTNSSPKRGPGYKGRGLCFYLLRGLSWDGGL